MQRFARLQSRLRNRSVQATRTRASLPMLHTQELSRSPQTAPKRQAADLKLLVSGLCVCKRRPKSATVGGGGRI
jgi:hypothetical protein